MREFGKARRRKKREIDQGSRHHHQTPEGRRSTRLICEALFLALYIERAGAGTLNIIRLCAEAGLPEPEFRSEHQQLTGASRKTATRDLDELIAKGVFKRVGEKRGCHYILEGRK